MNDDDLDLRIYARGGRRPGVPARPGRRAPHPTRELPVARPDAAAESAGAAEPAGVAEPAGATGAVRRVTRELAVAAASPVEEKILRILRAPPEWSEAVEGAFSRKERELAAVFESLAPAEAGELFHRLSSARPDDPVSTSFALMVPERRGRLLGFLIAAPRRAALARAGRHPTQPRRKDP